MNQRKEVLIKKDRLSNQPFLILRTKESNMKDYYLAQVRVIIDGKESIIVPISGQGYNPNVVKNSAERRVREQHPGKAIASVILSKEDMDLEEYKKIIGGNPPWLGGD